MGLAATLFCCLALLLCRPAGAAPGEVTLKNAVWTVTIDPASLQVSAQPSGKPGIQLSAPEPDLGPFAELKQTDQQAAWKLPGRSLAVSARWAGDTLSLHFQAGAASELTWPIFGGGRAIRGYI